MSRLGTPHLHLRATDSTNVRARGLAAAGAPHGTLVTAGEQSAGRGRQGRTWSAPAGQALLLSLVVRGGVDVLPLRAAVAVADVCGAEAQIKWPNDVLVDGLKVAGILVEGRPQEGWAVLGIGLNAGEDVAALPAELQDRAGTLGRARAELPAVLAELLGALEAALREPADVVLGRWRTRDALLDRPVRWSGGTGTGRGVDEHGRLVVELADGTRTALDAGEVHLGHG